LSYFEEDYAYKKRVFRRSYLQKSSPSYQQSEIHNQALGSWNTNRNKFKFPKSCLYLTEDALHNARVDKMRGR
jgi:hypothetical protein